MADSMTVFNRAAVRLHRDRAAAAAAEHGFLFAETAERLADRLGDITRDFEIGLDLGCRDGVLARAVEDLGKVRRLVQSDLSPAMARLAAGTSGAGGGTAVCADEEMLPFGPETFDCVLSNLALHWVNDLPGALVQIRRALKPDGLLLAALFGGDTLIELRDSLAAAEIAEEAGLSPRVSPFADIRDLGGLLQRAGLALPVADAETITVSYPDPLKLMADLRGMGEANACAARRTTVARRRTLMAAADIYRERYADAEGRVPATFQIVTLTAWAPHPSQPKPLKPGSAEVRLAEALDADDEAPGGEGET